MDSMFSKFYNSLMYLITKPIWAYYKIYTSTLNPFNSYEQHKLTETSNDYKTELFDMFNTISSASKEDVIKYWQEADEIKTNVLPNILISASIPVGFDASQELANICYTMVRLIKPSIVVETGVGRGMTSLFILSALEKNDKGRLYSIELPKARSYKEWSKDVGILVTDSLKDRWTLIFGPGAHEMKKLRNEISGIDLFVHDSNHSYLNQKMELRSAFSMLNKGGVILFDDVGNSAAVEESKKMDAILMLITQEKSNPIGVILPSSTNVTT